MVVQLNSWLPARSLLGFGCGRTELLLAMRQRDTPQVERVLTSNGFAVKLAPMQTSRCRAWLLCQGAERGAPACAGVPRLGVHAPSSAGAV